MTPLRKSVGIFLHRKADYSIMVIKEPFIKEMPGSYPE
jgi:hypothetical protein